MKYPKFLKEHSTIGIPAPSSGAYNECKKNRYKHAMTFFENRGYQLITSKNLFNSEKGRSASAKERAKEVTEMFKNKDIDAIICATGGDFLIEILPYVNFQEIVENPKYVMGFSDPTGILYPITSKYDIATIYGSNFSPFGAESIHKSQQDALKLIEGKTLEVHSYEKYAGDYQEEITGLESPIYNKDVYWKTLDDKEVELEGRILGGNFDIIAELSGTKYDGINDFNKKYKEDGIIWFFDNCEITLEETIRVLWKLKELDYFKYAKGILFGRFGVETTTYQYDVKTCLEDSVLKELNIPIIYDADFSHKDPCIPIINGSIAKLKVKDGKGTISFKLE